MKKWQKEVIEYCAANNFNNFANFINAMKLLYMPKKIYKYCSFDENKYNLKNLLYNKFYLNSPKNFNDPYDCCTCYYFNDVLYDITKLHIENSANLLPRTQKNIIKLLDSGMDIFQIQKKYKRRPDIIEEIDYIIEDIQDNVEEIYINNFREKMYENIKVTCFSEVPDNILMWAHYAQNHTGFCVEYDLTAPEFVEFKHNLFPVFYTDKPFKRLEKDEDLQLYSFYLLTFLTKFKDWNYEREWRYISLMDADKDFIEMPLPPANVFLGTKIKDKDYELISELCKINKIPCHKMFMRADKFYVQPSQCYC